MGSQAYRTGAQRRPARIRPAILLILATTLAYVGGLWLHLLHEADGAVEPGAPIGLVHWLRDSTLLLPIVLVATWLGLRLGRRLVAPFVEDGSTVLRIASLIAIMAVVVSVAEALASPLHGLVFGGAHHHGAEMPVALHMAHDGLLALGANFFIVAVVIVAVRGDAWTQRRSRRPDLRGSMVLQRAVGLTASAMLMASSAAVAPFVATSGTALAAANGPCPAGAATKTFDVSAIDIRMDLNRFGDNDPAAQMFVLDSRIPAVRAQEAALGRHEWDAMSIGLRDDAIQPLAIRANEGDCVVIHFTNRTTRPAPLATDNTYGIHIDGLAFAMDSSGDAIGNNAPSSVGSSASATYTYWVPEDPALEGAHYLHPGPGNRQAVAHGLFGALVVEPPGSTYLNMTTGEPQASGWEAMILPAGAKAFRENVKIFHEIGNESERNLPVDINGVALPTIDPHTGAYRPGSRAINYRSEPFMDRLNYAEDQKAVVYGSYTFGDTTNIIPRGYVGDPTKFRLIHAGSEVFHVYHLHGGADRWRFNAKADPTFDYGKTGLDKHPVEIQSESARLDSQSMGPGESFDLEIENGAGGSQQGAGEFLFHCHIAHHYFAGMWGYWRVYDTLQPDLMPLPDRQTLPQAVTSAALVGKAISGQTITASNLDAWIRPQLPTQGVTHDINLATRDNADQDASVWDWSVDSGTGLYLGEPDRASSVTLGGATVPWPDFANVVPGHPAALVVDQTVDSLYTLNGSKVHFDAGGYVGSRPKLLFNPTNGRPAWPMLRPHIGKRPPFAPNGHSGAPYLGESGGKAAAPVIPVGSTSTTKIDPWANRSDGICPTGAPLRTYNIVGIPKPIEVTDPAKVSRVVDPLGALDVLAADKAAIYAGTKTYAGVTHPESLAIRANIGDCIAVTYTSELTDGSSELPYSKTNIHIHHVQFDTQASDGVISGFSFEQSIRPYKIVDPQLTAPASVGSDTLTLTSVAKFQPGVWIGVGLGTDSIEVRQIVSIAANKNQVKLSQKLTAPHAAGEWAGTEFVQYRWYPDVELDNIFFHDHVNGIHGWSHGMVGQLIIEPQGSTYHDPVTGDPIRAGAAADIHTDPSCIPSPTPAGLPAGTSNQCALIPGVVPASYREFAVWTVNDHEPSTAEATINLRAEPWADRTCADPSRRFDQSCGGDPYTPILKAYVGDQVVIRNINVGQGTNTLTIDGHQTFWEPRYRDALGVVESSPIDTIHTTVSEKYTLILKGGAGGPNHVPGDYLYHDGENRRFKSGAWGILRVLPAVTSDIKPLPGATIPAQLPTCPSGAPLHAFAISAVDLPSTTAGGGQNGRKAAFVPSSLAAAVIAKQVFPEPLVMHVAAGECIQVTLKNQRATARASFHVGALLHDLGSSGLNVGNNPSTGADDQTVAPGGTRTYTYFADTEKLESATISDFGGDNSGWDGLYGSVVVAPAGATFTDPEFPQAVDIGSAVDVHVPGRAAYRDFTLILADQDPRIGQNTMPYPADVSGPALVNYRTAGVRADNAGTFRSSAANGGDPSTPILRAYAGDPVKVHVLGGPASEQVHVFNLGGMSWPGDMYVTGSAEWQSRAVGPWEKLDILVTGGAGGRGQQPGDYFYGDLRRPFTQAGMWGLFRVLPNTCANGGTTGLVCLGQAPAPDAPTVTKVDPASGPTSGGTPVTITGTGFDTSGATTVKFGANDATSVTCPSTTTCAATSPAGSGTVDVIVTSHGLASAASAASTFTYTTAVDPPVVTGIDPASGSTLGGTIVTITGTGFNPVADGTLVEFGTSVASAVTCTTVSCTATAPSAAQGPVHVRVTANGLKSAISDADLFTYVAPPPEVGLVQPNSGTVAGGTTVTITGTGFSSVVGATSVTFGGNAATGVTCTTSTICTATSPAGTAGTVDVIVTVGGVSSAVVPEDAFTYIAAVVSTDQFAVPALAKGTGYWFTFTTHAPGDVGAAWNLSARIQGTLAIYAGNPFTGRTDPVKLSPPAGAIVLDKGNKASFAATAVARPAGVYTAYFFASSAAPASAGAVTYMK